MVLRSSVAIAVLSVALVVAATFAIWQAAGAPWQSATPTQAAPTPQPILETQLEKCQRAQIAYEAFMPIAKEDAAEATSTNFAGKLLSQVISVCVPEVTFP